MTLVRTVRVCALWAVVAGIFTAIAFGSPGAHINPAITLTVAVLSGDWSNVGLFWTAQILGGFAGASLVWLAFLPHWKVTPDKEAKLAVFCNTPAIRNGRNGRWPRPGWPCSRSTG